VRVESFGTSRNQSIQALNKIGQYEPEL